MDKSIKNVFLYLSEKAQKKIEERKSSKENEKMEKCSNDNCATHTEEDEGTSPTRKVRMTTWKDNGEGASSSESIAEKLRQSENDPTNGLLESILSSLSDEQSNFSSIQVISLGCGGGSSDSSESD